MSMNTRPAGKIWPPFIIVLILLFVAGLGVGAGRRASVTQTNVAAPESASLAGNVPSGVSAAATENLPPVIPRGAWNRTIGDVPSPIEASDANRGIVLGGFGAGAFMYNISGSFGPWADEVGEFNKRRLHGAAFHVYENVGGVVKVKSLSTDTAMASAWSRITEGDGTYYALHPKGWCEYYCFATDVRSMFFSPIIPHNYRETSFPVAVWRFTLANPNPDTARVSVMLTWPNPPFNAGRRTRTGFFAAPVTSPGKSGMVLKASHPANTAETQNSEWCIATRVDGTVTVSRATWNPAGTGAGIWSQFADDGILSNQVNPYDSAAAVAVKVVLPPGGEAVIPFALAWDFPVVEFDSPYDGGRSTQWWKRYCEYFDTLSDNSFSIASEALNNYETWATLIDQWMAPYVNDTRYPDWLIRAAFNELYYNQFGGSFWEAGLRSGRDEEFLGLHPEDHKNFIMESQEYTLSGNISVGHYSSVVYARFWPEMERDLLRFHADAILYYTQCDPSALYQAGPEIGAPRDVLSTDSCKIGDPFFAVNVHGYHSRPAPCAPGTIHLQTETSGKFIQRCWRYYSLYEDLEFLEYIWPAAESTYQFMKSYDCEPAPKDSLPDAQGYDNTYDGWGMYGTDMYSGGFWIGALLALDTMAAILAKPVRGEIQLWLEAAQRNLDEQLWDGAGMYYHIDTDSDYPNAIFADALAGQRYCETTGLPDILPRWKMDAHLSRVYEICVLPNADVGVRLGRMPDGSIVPTGDRDTYEYWVGTTYWLAAMMHHAGMTDKALTTAFGAYHPVYEVDELAYWFNTPEAWRDGGYDPRPGSVMPYKLSGESAGAAPGEAPSAADGLLVPPPNQYQRPRAVWELIFEMEQMPPPVPILRWPLDLALIGDTTPIFRWSSTLVSGGTYTLQCARDGDFTLDVSTFSGLGDTMFTIPDTAAFSENVWFWRVQAIDNRGKQSGYQPSPFSFSIDPGIPCSCPDFCDCDGDHKINPVDVVFMVNYVYRNLDARRVLVVCPVENGDWNCDGAVNPVDIVYYVNYVYKTTGPGPCSPCSW